jgi:uncharacterized protein
MASQLPEIAQALLNPGIYPDQTAAVEIMQTQMSFIFLTGKYVYKLKKPVDLGYLDYTTLEKRHFFCRQEIILNRRLCPEMYLEVVPVTRSRNGFELNGSGEAVDYLVKMLYLPHERMLNNLLERSRATPEMIESVAHKMAEFHKRAETNASISEYGRLEAVKINTDENFSQTEKYIDSAITAGQYRRIKDYSYGFLQEKSALFSSRAISGKIRDCHGDLHSQHICFTNGICIFDCIEAVDRFRYCDVASEIAFLAMDLDHYGRADLSRSFSDSYIEKSRDYEIKELLKFYKCYRAYVRGKVNCFKYDDPYIPDEERKQTLNLIRSYFELADSYAGPKPRLFITVGLVGSGKSTLAQALAKRMGLTMLSSDIIRKQLAGILPTEHRFEDMESGIYSAEFSQKTYQKMYSDAGAILKNGDSVILDATFLKADERTKASTLAQTAGADFFVIECRLDEDNTQKRLTQRLKNTAVSDGRWEIYEPQKRKFEPVTEFLPEQIFSIDSSKDLTDQITSIIRQISV